MGFFLFGLLFSKRTLSAPIPALRSRPFDKVLFCALLVLGTTPAASAIQVDALVAFAPQPSFQTRHHALHALDRAELESAAPSLLRFLREAPVPEDWEFDDFHSFKNDIADRLIFARVRSNTLARLALEALNDDGEHPVWRDYCLQKLPDLIVTGDLAKETSQSAARALRHYASGAEPGLTGTALIAALRLGKLSADSAGDFDTLGEAALGRLAHRCAADPSGLLLDRVSALQIAAELGHPGSVALARKLLAPTAGGEPDAPAMLRVSALAALGQAGDPADLELVARYRRSPDIRLRAAARTAVQRLSSTNSP